MLFDMLCLIKHWICQDIFGFAMVVLAIEDIQLSSFTAGAILLLGLLILDALAVFGSDVMMTVADNIQAPLFCMCTFDGGETFLIDES